EGRAALRRGQKPGDHCLAGRHAERTAHELKILDTDDHREAFERARRKPHRVLKSGLRAGIAQAVEIASFIAELQWIDRHLRHRDRLELAFVKRRIEPRPGAHAHVIVGIGDHKLIGFEVLVEHQLSGLGTFDPQVLRHLTAQEAADLGPAHMRDPVHRPSPRRVLWPRAAAAVWPRTAAANIATLSHTAATVCGVARPLASRCSRTVSTRAEPTTTASAPAAMRRASSAVLTPNPTATGNGVCWLIRDTPPRTRAGSGTALAAMPVIGSSYT